MDIRERIARRRRRRSQGNGLVVDALALAPITHTDEPVGRGPVLERLLDVLDPVFDDGIPTSANVTGPPGTGKTAVVRALFDELDTVLGRRSRAIATTTRASVPMDVRFAVVDGRQAASEFQAYRHLLSALTDETVPEGGVSTTALRDRVHETTAMHDAVVVAVDHVDEPDTLDVDVVTALAEDTPIVPWYVTRQTLASLDETPAHDVADTVTFDPYRRHTLVEIVTDRASTGLAPNALDHEEARYLAEYAKGDAHDALALLYDAATRADGAKADRVHAHHVEAAIDGMPEDPVSVGRALAQSANHQRVLAALVELDEDAPPLPVAADRIAARTGLTESTVTRFLYELADVDLLARTPGEDGTSTVAPRFPPHVFAALHTDET